MQECARCKGTGKFKFGGMYTKCKCPPVFDLSVAAKLTTLPNDFDITPPSFKKKRKRRDGQGASIDNG